MKRGVATFTLDWGKCPKWLFERMVRLGRIVSLGIIDYFGPDEFLKRLSDPVWFQSFGSLLAFDWNASGLTTTTMGALKVALYDFQKEIGFYIAGGKGKTSKKTPSQIIRFSEEINLDPIKANRYVYLSKLAAKVDSSLVQDGFQLYHHNFLFTKNNKWGVIQQGMNINVGKARRYHWYSDTVNELTIEPHNAIQSEISISKVLNLTHKKSIQNRQGVVELVKHKKDLFYEIKRFRKYGNQLTLLDLSSKDFSDHPISRADFSQKQVSNLSELFSDRLEDSVQNIVDRPVKDFESVVMTKKVGPKTVRALTLVSEVLFGAKPSYEDPIRYTYAFGGKDGIPYPVNKDVYDSTIDVIEKAIKKSSLNPHEKEKILRKNEKVFKVNVKQ